MSEVMTDKSVDEPVKFCDENVIALFPVRYALSGAKLSAISQGSTSVSVPTNKNKLVDHELRRIRAGYIYVFGDNAIWRIYRYLASSETDENSTLDFGDVERDSAAKYKFYELNWSNGANSVWTKQSDPTPFVILSASVTTAWVAYSEERWPAHMLELLQDHDKLREKVMVKVDLSKEDTPHSFKLDQLENYVAEFKKNAPANPAENEMRYTQMQPEGKNFITHLCDRNQETARVVALRDDLGEIADLGALHLQIGQAIQQFSREHHYATSMANCVELVKDHVDKNLSTWKKWTNDHPLNPNFSTLRDQIVTDIAAQRERPKAIVKMMAEIFARSGNFSANTEISICTNGISEVDNTTKAEAWAYAWFLIGRSWQFTSVTPVGMTIMGAVSVGEAPGALGAWFGVMTKLINASIKGNYVYNYKNLRHFNFAISSQAHAFAAAWVTRSSGLEMMDKLLKPVGAKMVNQKVPMNLAANMVRTQFEQVGLRNSMATLDATTGKFNSAQTTLLNIPMINGTIESDLSSSGQKHFTRLHNAENVLKGVGLLTGLVATYSALGQLSEIKKNSTQIKSVTTLGALANNEIVQVVSELIGVMDAFNDVRTMQTVASFGSIRAKAMQSLFKIGSQFNINNITILKPQTSGNAVAINGSKLMTLGNAALAIGAAIAIGKSYEGFTRGDSAAFIGNGLVAIGSIILIVTGSTGIGAIVGLVIIAIGSAITIFADTDLESWIRGSFWGEGYYVYWDEDREADFSRQLEKSKTIASPNNSEISNYYKKELEAFLDLIGGIEIKNTLTGDNKLQILCRDIKSPADVSKLKVELTAPLHIAPGTIKRPLPGVTHKKRFLGSGMVEVEFLNYTPSKLKASFGSTSTRVTVTARFPKYQGGEWTDTLNISGDKL